MQKVSELYIYRNKEVKLFNDFVTVDLLYQYPVGGSLNWYRSFHSKLIVKHEGVDYVYAGHLTTLEALNSFKRDLVAKRNAK